MTYVLIEPSEHGYKFAIRHHEKLKLCCRCYLSGLQLDPRFTCQYMRHCEQVLLLDALQAGSWGNIRWCTGIFWSEYVGTQLNRNNFCTEAYVAPRCPNEPEPPTRSSVHMSVKEKETSRHTSGVSLVVLQDNQLAEDTNERGRSFDRS